MVCLIFLVTPVSVFSVQARLDFKIASDQDVFSFPLNNSDICILDAGTLKIYHHSTPIRSIDFKRGEGPGEFRVVQKIYSRGKYFYIWDRLLFRLSVFTDNWKLNRIIKFPSFRRLAGFLGITGNHYFFRWGTTERSPARINLIEHVGIIDKNQMKSIITIPAGEWRKQEYLNFDRPIPMVAISGNTIYWSTNREYRIHKIRINGKKTEHINTIIRQVQPIKFTDDLKQLKYEILSQSRQSLTPKEIYPSFVPLLADMAVDGEWLAVITNEKIHLRKAKVDIFRKERYIGSIEIPLIYSQYFIFPFSWPNYFPSGTYLQGNRLYTYHYDKSEDRYKIICHTIIDQ
jgi:hypothetical protein